MHCATRPVALTRIVLSWSLSGEDSMYRRQFLQTVNAIGASIVLPASAYCNATTLDNFPTISQASITNTRAIMDTGRNGSEVPRIGIVAIGRQGCAVLNALMERLPSLTLSIAIDTDAASLLQVNADRTILVGNIHENPLDPRAARQVGHSFLLEFANAIAAAGLNIVLLVTNMDDASDSRMASLAVKILQEQKIFTLAFVTAISNFGNQKVKTDIRELQAHVNTLIPFTHGNIEPVVGRGASSRAFSNQAAVVLGQLWHGILNKIGKLGLIYQFDFEDLRRILNYDGECALGFDSASGVDGAVTAAIHAIDHPLLGQYRLKQASGLLITVRSPREDFRFRHWAAAVKKIKHQLPKGPAIISSAYYEKSLGNKTTVLILASGIGDD